MHDLSPQPRPARRDASFEGVEDALDDVAPLAIIDCIEEPAQLGCVCEVPEQLATGRRVEEGAEREIQAGVHGGESADRLVVEPGSPGASVQPLEKSDVMTVVRRTPGQRPSNRQLRVDAEHMRDRGVLEIENRSVLAEIRDLEDRAALAVVDQEGRVSLAAEVGRRAADAEELVRYARDLVSGEARRLRLEDGHSSEIEAFRDYDRLVYAEAQPVGDADLASVGALLAEPARAKVLLALSDGRSLPASMLAAEAGVAASTASHHLARLVDGGFLSVVTRGRHRYYALAGPDVAELLEAVARFAPAGPITSLREGTRAHALRYARRCYDHLAGRLGVAVTDALEHNGFVVATEAAFTLTRDGADGLSRLGFNVHTGEVGRACRDWTEQRCHIAGPLGRHLLTGFVERGWLEACAKSRALQLTAAGADALSGALDVSLP
jgi:DNA-binding transcriptional ArsR family regulator